MVVLMAMARSRRVRLFRGFLVGRRVRVPGTQTDAQAVSIGPEVPSSSWAQLIPMLPDRKTRGHESSERRPCPPPGPSSKVPSWQTLADGVLLGRAGTEQLVLLNETARDVAATMDSSG